MKRQTGSVGITAIKIFLIIRHVDNLKTTEVKLIRNKNVPSLIIGKIQMEDVNKNWMKNEKKKKQRKGKQSECFNQSQNKGKLNKSPAGHNVKLSWNHFLIKLLLYLVEIFR